MAKFSGVKVGEQVWSTVFGYGKIHEILSKDKTYPIGVDFGNTKIYFTTDGYNCTMDKYPSLFWNEFHIPTNEEDKKPFDLVEYLKENLQPIEFNEDKFNYFLTYNVRSKELEFNASMICIDIHLTYFHLNSDELKSIEKVLNDNKVTIQQLKQAYKILNWL